MSIKHPPMFNFTMYKYWAEVRDGFRCPCYSLPFGKGGRLLNHVYNAGDWVEILDDSREWRNEELTSTPVEYVSVATKHGWINVWTLKNLSHQPVGVFYCSIHIQLKPLLKKRFRGSPENASSAAPKKRNLTLL